MKTILLILSGIALTIGKLIELDSSLEDVRQFSELIEYGLVKRTKSQLLVAESVQKFENPLSGDTSTGPKPVGNKTQAIGTQGRCYHDGYDKGFFSTIYNAYAYHWGLVTGPEDWWFTILRTIALAVDRNANKPNVRNFFVSHKGKKELVVKVPSLRDTKFSWFFEQMTEQVSKNLNVPEYVDLARPKFSTTETIHTMVENIAIMSSLQEYFEYTLSIECGIPRVEMKGKLEDWELLKENFIQMKNLLQKLDILADTWWNNVEVILDNLVSTYNEDQEAIDWWKGIISSSGFGCGGPISYSGWFMKDLLGVGIEDAPLGIVTTPLTIDDNGHREEAAVVAGIAGFDFVKDLPSLPDDKIFITANYVWGLYMLPDSSLRNTLV